jgi:hypothetical protein
MTMEEQQRWFSDTGEFNYERPHEALAGATPGTVWHPEAPVDGCSTMLIRQEERSTG